MQAGLAFDYFFQEWLYAGMGYSFLFNNSDGTSSRTAA